MDFPRKIILAACACAAGFAGICSCTVEERNIEQKHLFACASQDDCLEGSTCVGADPAKKIIGSCVRNEDVEHCHDFDGDGFYGADEGYDNECGFSEKNPKDPDDTDNAIYPGATEYCDGKDNSGDGCVDGICPTGKDCIKTPSDCNSLVEACLGRLPVDDSRIDQSICAPKYAGVNACINGQMVYAFPNDGKYSAGSEAAALTADGKYYKVTSDAHPDAMTACPNGGTDLNRCSCPDEKFTAVIDGKTIKYTEFENGDPATDGGDKTLCDSFDNDCNGTIDEFCKAEEPCSEQLKEMTNVDCYYLDGLKNGTIENDSLQLSMMCIGLTTDKLTSCGCIGKYKCIDPAAIAAPVCVSILTETPVISIEQAMTAHPGETAWKCTSD